MNNNIPALFIMRKGNYFVFPVLNNVFQLLLFIILLLLIAQMSRKYYTVRLESLE